MKTLTINMPDKIFSAMRVHPDDFVKEMRLAAAIGSHGKRFLQNRF